ncbi:MAG: hypothetical protein LBQ21_07035 [Clostridiales Family XIII bacterium]|jgi:hypothetical protein|nr:hypothetical protein [Clostridiales Family XIII bacterium]
MNTNRRKTFSAKRIAVCGVLLALSLALLYFASFVPNVEGTVMAVAGALVYVATARFSAGVGAGLYVASVLLALLFVPVKPAILPYIFCFGPYGVLKAPIEKAASRLRGKAEERSPVFAKMAEYLLKIAVFVVLTGSGLLIFKAAFFSSLHLPDLAVPVLGIGAFVLFLLYDRILSLIYAVVGDRIK